MIYMNTILSVILRFLPSPQVVEAHCDGPCGVYDPAQARVAAEAVLSMTKKLLDLKMPSPGDVDAMRAFQNTFTRYVQIKEQEAENAKHHLLVLWTDYFKPEHLETFPALHDTFWKAAKLCSSCKQEISLSHANELLSAVEEIHGMFWESKERDVQWELANPSA